MTISHEEGARLRAERVEARAAERQAKAIADKAEQAVRRGGQLVEAIRKTLSQTAPLDVLAAVGVATGKLAADVAEGDAAIAKAHEVAAETYAKIRAGRVALHEAQAKRPPLPLPKVYP